MTTTDTQLKNRTKQLNSVRVKEGTGSCVLYVMSRDQRITDNHALRAAQLHAQSLNLPVVVGFALYPSSESRAKEYAAFMLDGLRELMQQLDKKRIPFVYKRGFTSDVVRQLVSELEPAALYFDFSPLRRPLQQQRLLANELALPVFVVDTHNIVPVWVASNKQEYAARTIRPKIHTHMADYLSADCQIISQPAPSAVDSSSSSQLVAELNTLSCDSAGVVHGFKSGEAAAQKTLDLFIQNKLRGYAKQRNDPSIDGLSNLSPYLHFGQLSSRRAVQQALQAQTKQSVNQEDVDAFIEEIVVRKELSDNYCYFNQQYDRLEGAPDWAQKTLHKHSADPRQHIYNFDDFKQAGTHDKAWNAAQLQLVSTGKIHGYMRMYWAKKVLEWTVNPDDALRTLIQLNDFYSIDGGDPNGYVGILWAIGGLHDRPWQERPVYGTVRSMVYGGLQRKFDIEQYIDKYTKQC